MVIRYIKNLINEIVKLKKESIVDDYTKGVDKHKIKDKYIKRWIRNILSSLNINTDLNESTFMNTIQTHVYNANNTVNNTSNINNLQSSKQNIENLIAYKNKLQQIKEVFK